MKGIGEVIARVTVEDKHTEPKISWVNDEELPEDTLIEWAVKQINQRWKDAYPVQALLIGEILDTSFEKDSKGGMFSNNRTMDLSKISHTTVEDLAESLAKMKWSDLN